VETLVEMIEKELEELEKIMKSGGYGFSYAKGFLREAKKHCEAGDLEKCLDYIRRAREGAEEERRIASALEELRNVVRRDLSLKRLYEEVVSKIREGDFGSAESILNVIRSKVGEVRRRFEAALNRYREEVREIEEMFKGLGFSSALLTRAKNLLDELQGLLARGDFEGFEKLAKEFEAVLHDAKNEAEEIKRKLEKKRIPDLEQLLSASLSGLASGYSCREGYKPRTVNLPRGVAPEGFEGEWICCLLGCGGWGCAYRCEKSGEVVVFKIPRGFESIIEYGSTPTVSVKLMEKIVEEADTIMRLRHPNILRLYASSRSAPLLIYEYADYGSLEWQLSRGWRPSLRDVLLVSIQVGDAVRYIHSRGLLHGDIKAGNIFFVKGVAKLGDFSSLTKLLATTSSHSYACTPGWCAPEQLFFDLAKKASERGLESRIDVYQLGNLVLYLLTGSTIDGREVVKPGKIDEYMKSVKHEKLREILKEMLSPEPWSRISSDEAVKMFLEVYREVSE